MKKFGDALRYLFYLGCYSFVATFVGGLFPVRSSGSKTIPKKGGVLVLTNHQSYLDPIIVGITSGRRCRYLARSSLFKIPGFRWMIQALGAIPIEREGVAKEGLKAAIEALNAGDLVLIFPEGTRTRDGYLQELKPGVLLLVRRSNAEVVIGGIAGAFESWPRYLPFPIPRTICIHYDRFVRSADKVDNELELNRIHATMFEATEAAKRHRHSLTGIVSPSEPLKNRPQSLT